MEERVCGRKPIRCICFRIALTTSMESSSVHRFPPPPPPRQLFTSPSSSSHQNQTGMGKYSHPVRGRWEPVECAKGSAIPCQRSLHAGAVWRSYFYVFGGYDGQRRVNDLYQFCFNKNMWTLLSNTNAPSARDRHIAVVHENHLYIFGGFDGVARVNGMIWLLSLLRFLRSSHLPLLLIDLHAFDLEDGTWSQIIAASGEPPTPRHSHAAVVYKDNMYIFGGYDGSYRNDFHAFNFTTRTWRAVRTIPSSY